MQVERDLIQKIASSIVPLLSAHGQYFTHTTDKNRKISMGFHLKALFCLIMSQRFSWTGHLCLCLCVCVSVFLTLQRIKCYPKRHLQWVVYGPNFYHIKVLEINQSIKNSRGLENQHAQTFQLILFVYLDIAYVRCIILQPISIMLSQDCTSQV